jgi:hypothetical protein
MVKHAAPNGRGAKVRSYLTGRFVRNRDRLAFQPVRVLLSQKAQQFADQIEENRPQYSNDPGRAQRALRNLR